MGEQKGNTQPNYTVSSLNEYGVLGSTKRWEGKEHNYRQKKVRETTLIYALYGGRDRKREQRLGCHRYSSSWSCVGLVVLGASSLKLSSLRVAAVRVRKKNEGFIG
ncbi:hypothetical protein DdX_11627 [Ditylenchus destructor]|uniref:Uncharacterized protein n=1 Tax=Ditylenchus destructor TaxID=166010 RepID=A0AAD4R479_9BILA|nr:hypothetical protein DdX_11627 [Ditylenchus destructor]